MKIFDIFDVTASQIIRFFLSLCLFSFALTLLFLSMRSVLNIGGFCAQGGPYIVATSCPKGIPLVTTSSILIIFTSFIINSSVSLNKGPEFPLIFWMSIFGALGWNFFEFAINPTQGNGIVWAWMVCAIVFFFMGPGLCLLTTPDKIIAVLTGYEKTDSKKERISKFQLTLLNIIILLVGILIGYFAFQIIT